MTEDAKSRYEEDKPHYEVIRSIVKEELKSIERNISVFFWMALAVFGFMFLTQFGVWKELQQKADKNEVVTNMQYYQIEEDEHRMVLELFPDVNKATNVFNRINDNIASSLGFKYTTRGATTKP